MTNDEIITLIENKYYECPNVEKGRCDTWWRHDDCVALAEILFEITKNDKYNQHKQAKLFFFDKDSQDTVE
jgi:hypothetical protein